MSVIHVDFKKRERKTIKELLEAINNPPKLAKWKEHMSTSDAQMSKEAYKVMKDSKGSKQMLEFLDRHGDRQTIITSDGAEYIIERVDSPYLERRINEQTHKKNRRVSRVRRKLGQLWWKTCRRILSKCRS